jgi:hypothetical protein
MKTFAIRLIWRKRVKISDLAIVDPEFRARSPAEKERPPESLRIVTRFDVVGPK